MSRTITLYYRRLCDKMPPNHDFENGIGPSYRLVGNNTSQKWRLYYLNCKSEMLVAEDSQATIAVMDFIPVNKKQTEKLSRHKFETHYKIKANSLIYPFDRDTPVGFKHLGWKCKDELYGYSLNTVHPILKLNIHPDKFLIKATQIPLELTLSQWVDNGAIIATPIERKDKEGRLISVHSLF